MRTIRDPKIQFACQNIGLVVWYIKAINSDLIERYRVCIRESSPRREPIIPSKFPDYPWQKIGTDLFHMKRSNYIFIISYFSRFITVIKLKSTTSRGRAIIEAFKSVFSHYSTV